MKQLKDKIQNLIELNRLNLSNIQIDLVEKYIEQLLKYNKNINLISRKDENHIVERHIIPCLVFSKMFGQFSDTFLDIGTGGGLPGITFAISNPDSSGFLVDSIEKKIKSLIEIVIKIKLDNVQLICTRVESKNFQSEFQKKFDMIISRGTDSLYNLIQYSKKLIRNKKSKLALMKGGDLTKEISEAKKKFRNIEIKLIPLIYFPDNEFNQNNKFAVIVENFNE